MSGAAAVGMVAAFGDQNPTPAGVAAVGGATIVFVAFSLLLGSLARSGAKGQLLDFDRSNGYARGRARRWGWTRPVDESFQALAAPRVTRLERESDDDLFLVQVDVRGRGRLELGPVDDEDEARQWCDRLAAVLG